MKNNRNQVAKWLVATLAVSAMVVVSCSCGKSDETPTPGGTTGTGGTDAKVSGSISIDGSTTVYPSVNTLAEDFGKANPDVKLDVTKSGTGSGFKKFIEGNLDICMASRTIEDKEEADLKAKGIEYVEVPIAYDGVSVVVNPANTFIGSMTLDELKKAWGPDSKVTKWSDIRAGLPAEEITFNGPTDNHGTYEYFTEKVAKKNEIRKGYRPNQEYNAIVQAVASDKNGIAYMGYSYYIENKDKLKIVPVDGVEPSPETIANGTYKPLSRTLFIYVSKKALDSKPEVKKFVEYALGEGVSAVTENEYVELPKEAYDLVKERVAAGKIGSIFAKAEAGKTTVDILKAAK